MTRFPSLRSDQPEPIWDGGNFKIGTDSVRILDYLSAKGDFARETGWSDELTAFHEDTAGSDHFIDIASRKHALGQIQRFVQAPSPVLMDVGCSSGFILQMLRQANPNGVTIGADIVKAPLQALASKINNVALLRFDLIDCPLPDNFLDGVVLLNVLEHIEQDDVAVAQLYRILKPGGVAVIEVPAGPELFDNYDKLLMHYRRYEMRGLKKLMTGAGFRVEYASHLAAFIYPGFWTVKQLSKLKPPAPEAEAKAVERNISTTRSSKVMKLITDVELALGRYVSYPFGIRCLITCSKPGP
jgi:SAM-dependent methyltransferase